MLVLSAVDGSEGARRAARWASQNVVGAADMLQLLAVRTCRPIEFLKVYPPTALLAVLWQQGPKQATCFYLVLGDELSYARVLCFVPSTGHAGHLTAHTL